MVFYMYQRNSCIEIHVTFQTGTELPFCFNLEGFTVFCKILIHLIYLLKIITYTAFKFFWDSGVFFRVYKARLT